MKPVDLRTDYDKYLDYLESRTWSKLRNKALERDDFHCCLCNNPHNLEVHHLKYPDLLGTEPISDLITLCRECHKNLEEYKKNHMASLKKTTWTPPRKVTHRYLKFDKKEDAEAVHNTYHNYNNDILIIFIAADVQKQIECFISKDDLEYFKEMPNYKEVTKWECI